MQSGLTITQLAQQIEANRDLKHDLVAPARDLHVFLDDDRKPQVLVPGATGGQFPILSTAHDQVGARLEIPGRYYDRMLAQEPALYRDSVNTWLQRTTERRMLRTLGGDLRAFLSDRYQRIENEEIAQVALPILADIPGVKIVSAQITERRMYIAALAPQIEGEVKVGDVVQAGVIISNSEIGYGAVSISPMVYRLVCLNGMKVPDGKFTARHVGRRIEEGADLNGIFADDTRKADDRAVLLKVRDIVRAAVDQVRFRETLDKMRGLTEGRITGDPSKVVEVLAKKVGASEAERGGILRSLIEGADLSAWGLVNAITHQAHSAPSFDRNMEWVDAGGRLLDLPASEWKEALTAN